MSGGKIVFSSLPLCLFLILLCVKSPNNSWILDRQTDGNGGALSTRCNENAG